MSTNNSNNSKDPSPWVYVKDRLPEKDGMYYVAEANFGNGIEDADIHEIVAHLNQFRDGKWVDLARYYSNFCSNIYAWLKLPDPCEYK